MISPTPPLLMSKESAGEVAVSAAIISFVIGDIGHIGDNQGEHDERAGGNAWQKKLTRRRHMWDRCASMSPPAPGTRSRWMCCKTTAGRIADPRRWNCC